MSIKPKKTKKGDLTKLKQDYYSATGNAKKFLLAAILKLDPNFKEIK